MEYIDETFDLLLNLHRLSLPSLEEVLCTFRPRGDIGPPVNKEELSYVLGIKRSMSNIIMRLALMSPRAGHYSVMYNSVRHSHVIRQILTVLWCVENVR